MSKEIAPSPITEFCIVCSGANRRILDQDECFGERSKYAMIGMFVLLTAVFATFSSSYALYLVGLLWAAFIFTVDRFIISTIRKKEIDPDLPLFKRLRLWGWELGKLTPRLLLAFLISYVISTPLELRYFEPEIKTRIADKNTGERDAKVKELERSIQILDEKREARRQEGEKVRNELIDELDGRRGHRKGDGPVAGAIRNELSKIEQSYQSFERSINDEINKKRGEIEGIRNQSGKHDQTFLESLTALSELAAESSTVWWAGKFITLLILMLECTPIIMKVMVGYGPYDSVLAAEEYEVWLRSRSNISKMNRDANHHEAFNTSKDSLLLNVKEGLAREAVYRLCDIVEANVDGAIRDAAGEVVNQFNASFPGSNNTRH